MTKEELHNHIKNVSEDYISKSWNTFLDLDETDLILAGIGVGKIIASEQEKRIADLELKIKHLTEHLEPQTMTALFEQVEEEVKQEQRIKKLEKENAELKAKIYGGRYEAIYTKLNADIFLLEKQNKEFKNKLAKAKEIILKLYNAGRDVLMCRAEEKAYDNLSEAINDRSIEQFLSGVGHE